MTVECVFGARCVGAYRGRPADPATHVVLIARTDEPGHEEVLRLCTEDAKTYVGGSIEVANGPQVITVVKLDE